MRTDYLTTCALAAFAGLAIHTSVLAAGLETGGVKFMFPVGVTFMDGSFELYDKVNDGLDKLEGPDYDYDVGATFVGISLNPRVEFPFGLGVGLTVGPTEFLFVTKDYNDDDDYDDDNETDVSFIVPVGGYVQYNFLRDKTVSPYARVGVRYPITGGDYIKSGSVGPFFAVGVELYRTKKVGFGAEVGYDWSEVKVNTGSGGDQTVRPIGFNFSVFALF